MKYTLLILLTFQFTFGLANDDVNPTAIEDSINLDIPIHLAEHQVKPGNTMTIAGAITIATGATVVG